MTSTPDISVVIPVFNRADSLRRSIQSALSQSISGSLEIVVVDDASTYPVTWNADPRVRIVRHVVNQGAAAARNTGVREARAQAIAFLDSDDIWERDKLARQFAVLQSGSSRVIGVFSPWAFEVSASAATGVAVKHI